MTVDTGDYDIRFGGIQRLVGRAAQERLRQAHVCVVGIGGVGSWAVEALARSGIGTLTLIDLDEVCVSNVNRQLPALTAEVGKPKALVMKERILGINPAATVHSLELFFTPATADQLLQPKFDFVVDAIDQLANKCLLLARCKQAGIPVITTGGAGGRQDGSALRVADLAFTSHDGLLQKVRKLLRSEHRFPSDPKTPFGIDCVYSTEPQIFPQPDGTVCATKAPSGGLRLNCDSGYGTATYVTGAFGFLAASRVIKHLAAQ